MYGPPKPIDWDAVKAALEQPSNYTMENYLDGLTSDMDQIVDESGLTLLHLTVLHGSTSKVKLLLDRAKQNNIVDGRFKNWMNARSHEEEWTALHYASFTQNLHTIYTLIQYEADVTALNANKLNMLHVAA